MLLVATAVVVLALGVTRSDASVGARQVVDRTFGCVPQPLSGKLRATEVVAVPRGAAEGRDPLAPLSPGFVGVSSGGWRATSELVSVRAARWRRFGATASAAGVFVNRICSPSRIAVTLSSKAAAGSPVRWAKRVTCVGPGRVIVRVRAVLTSSDPWRPLVTRDFDGATGTVISAAVAVRSEQSGTLLAYVELARDGTTRFWRGAGCAR